MAAKFKKGDRVEVIAGKDKGKQGDILTVVSGSRRVVVSGVNVARRHTRPSQTTPGGIVDKEMSLDVSNVCSYRPER